MCPQNIAASIGLKEVFDAVWTEFNYISRTVRISNKIRLDSKILITIGRVWPENINSKLLLRSGNLMDNLERPLDLLDLLQIEKGATDTTMQANYFFIDDSAQRQPIEQIVHLVEDGVKISRLLAQSAAAFLGETENIIDPLVFMIASEQVNLFREFDLQSHQKANRL